MTLVVAFEKPSGGFELAVVANAGEDSQNFALWRARVTNAVRRKKRKAQRFSEPHRHLVAALFDRIAVPLQFDIDTLLSEESRQLLNILPRFVITLAGKRSGQHTLLAACQTHQSFRLFGDLLQRRRSCSSFLFALLVA